AFDAFEAGAMEAADVGGGPEQGADLMTAGVEGVDEVGADKTRGAGDKAVHRMRGAAKSGRFSAGAKATVLFRRWESQKKRSRSGWTPPGSRCRLQRTPESSLRRLHGLELGHVE